MCYLEEAAFTSMWLYMEFVAPLVWFVRARAITLLGMKRE